MPVFGSNLDIIITVAFGFLSPGPVRLHSHFVLLSGPFSFKIRHVGEIKAAAFFISHFYLPVYNWLYFIHVEHPFSLGSFNLPGLNWNERIMHLAWER